MRGSGLASSDILMGLADSLKVQAQQLSMRTVYSASQSRSAHTELLGGVALTSETQLTSRIGMLGNFNLLMSRPQREKLAAALSSGFDQAMQDGQWSSQYRFYANSLPGRESAVELKRMAELLLENSQIDRCQVVLDTLRSSTHADIVAWASWQALQLSSSSEMAAWTTIVAPHSKSFDNTSKAVVMAAYRESSASSPFENIRTDVAINQTSNELSNNRAVVVSAFAGQVSSASPTNPIEINSQRETNSHTETYSRPLATDWFIQAERSLKDAPALRGHPALLMATAKNMRLVGNVASQRVLLEQLAAQSPLISWSQAAKQELAVLDNRHHQLRYSSFAQQAPQRPHLDGMLSENCWREATPMVLATLRPDENQLSTTVKWSYDAQFLYLAIACARDSRWPLAPPVQKRKYDADLKGLDQVHLLIDTDRDYSTAFELVIAENGQTADRCLGCVSFNPKWFVHVLPRPEAWQAEVAIPLDQLTTTPKLSGQCWSVSARRSGPGNTLQSWSQLKTHQPIPEANGLLIFK
jgi:hypothetical protein